MPVSSSSCSSKLNHGIATPSKYRPRPFGHCVGTRSRPGRGATSSSLLNGARTGPHALQAPQLHSAGSQAGTGARTPAGIGARQAIRGHSRSVSPHYRSCPSGAHEVHPFSKPKPGSNLRVRAFSPIVRTSDSSKPSSLVAWMSILMSSFAPAPTSHSMTSRMTLPMSRT